MSEGDALQIVAEELGKRMDRMETSRRRFRDELNGRLDGLQTSIDEAKNNAAAANETAGEARDQAVKTNGRVTKLELWRERIMGGLILIAAAGVLAALRELVVAVLT